MPFHPAVDQWLREAFGQPTPAQAQGWPAIQRGDRTLVLAPTGSGKTLAAFLACIDRLMFQPPPDPQARCRVVYISPLKALAVDVERNLRAPLAGISRVAAQRGDWHTVPEIAIRTGDTPTAARARFTRTPADILITTPESLFLLLCSRAREALASVETVIVDEIHAVAPTKRGAHLALSLERLERVARGRVQRIGLSATVRPVEEVARFLGGATVDGAAAPQWRDVTIIDARQPKRLDLHVEIPVEDVARTGGPAPIPSGPTSQPPTRASIWASIHPRLLELVRAHRSTLLFVNSRRLAERLAAALNELAGEPLVRSHHGSLAREQREEVEDLLKSGRLRALVATSSLELGIDMGAIDLVIQIEAPPSVASGLQRIGRAGHQMGAASTGVIVPKYRGDLLAAAAVSAAMVEGQVEAMHMPRNPLDVLAQQAVAMVAVDTWSVDDLFDAIRGAAPFSTLGRQAFEGVLDLLSGRYPSNEFAELRPRLTWDRLANQVTARQGALRVAIANAGTIPDRGLYGVFLAGADPGKGRVGELDEEMVFESRVGETFLLGASSWRIEDITHDRVVVSPAPGEPGKMPFWKGDAPGRPRELGLAIGRLTRELREASPSAAAERLERVHHLDRTAAEYLLQYLGDQVAVTGAVPDDRTIVIERCRDEVGDWRVLVLSPFGGRVLIPWCLAVVARLADQRGLDVDTMWSDDGFVVRLPDTEEPPELDLFLPRPDEVEALVLRQLGASALFAGRFREAAGRALLLPRRRPGARTALWQQRKRSADLLAVAAQYPSFPLILETYRECLRDVFDVPALVDTLRQVAAGAIAVVAADTPKPSPFGASLLFNYVATFLYDGDAPLAERRAQALAVDHAQLGELLGEAELRELLDPDVIETVERQLQALDDDHRATSADGLHDLLLRIGELSRAGIEARVTQPFVARAVDDLVVARRAIPIPVAGEPRFAAVEDAARYRDGLGTPLPAGLPQALLEPVADPLGDLVRRYARTHGPFTTGTCAARFGVAASIAEQVLARLARDGRVIQGEFRPDGTEREWCDAGVLNTLRQRSLARLRRQVAPVDAASLGRFTTAWHGVTRPRPGLDALMDVVEQLQGTPLPASELEREIIPARVEGYRPADLDRLLSAGEVVWLGLESLGDRDGRVALYLTDHLRLLTPPVEPAGAGSDLERRIVTYLAQAGASFFPAIREAAGGGFPQEIVDGLWRLVWRGVITNDSLHALRAFVEPPERSRRREPAAYRSRRITPPAAQGRWSLVAERLAARPSATEWATSVARQLLARHGVLTREAMSIESVPGAYGTVYPVLRGLEDAGRVRRGLFVGGLGAAQFALSPALDLLRSLAEPADAPAAVSLASVDPANPYGGILRWPAAPEGARNPTRSAGTRVFLVDGELTAWMSRRDRDLIVWIVDDEPRRTRQLRALSSLLGRLASDSPGRQGLLVTTVNGRAVADHPLATFLAEAGFTRGALGLAHPRRRQS